MKIIKTIFKCDTCKKKLPETHLSLTFGKGWSGWVHQVNTGEDKTWCHFGEFLRVSSGQTELCQFCSGKCLEGYFK